MFAACCGFVFLGLCCHSRLEFILILMFLGLNCVHRQHAFVTVWVWYPEFFGITSFANIIYILTPVQSCLDISKAIRRSQFLYSTMFDLKFHFISHHYELSSFTFTITALALTQYFIFATTVASFVFFAYLRLFLGIYLEE